MISRKLLSEVLNIKIYYINTKKDGALYIPDNCIGFEWDNNGYRELSGAINIYELAHKCKEWAYKNGWLLQVRTGTSLSVADIFNSDKQELHIRKQISEKIEPEAIFKACQWILEQQHES